MLEYWDGHKHVDMCVREARLFIEVDGPQHKKNYNQINSDLERDYWSRKQKYETLRFTNQEVRYKLNEVVQEIIKKIHEKNHEYTRKGID